MAPPQFSKAFSPATVAVNGASTLTFTIDNTANAAAATALDFTDTLPTGVQIASAPNASTSCTGGTLTAAANGTTISYTGGTVNVSASCTLSVDVVGTAAGSHVNTSGNLTSSLGSSGTATATLVVGSNPPAFSKVFAPATVNINGASTLTFTIDNTANAAAATALDFTDTLPAGVQIASAPNASTTCTGGTLTAAASATTISYTGGTVNASASCTLSVDVVGAAAGSHVNTSGDLTSSNGNSGTASATLVVQARGTLDLAKSFTGDPVRTGETVTLEFTITNTDASNTATSIGFTDDLDAALSGLAATGLPASNVCGAGSEIAGASILTLTGGNLAAEASCVFSVTLQVPANTTPGTYTNTTSQITGTISGTTVTGDPAQDDLEITEVVDPTQEVISNFLIRRTDLITIEDPLLTSHLNSAGSSANGPVNVTALGQSGGAQMTFSTSLMQMARSSEAERAANRPKLPGAMALGYSKGSGAAETAHPFDVWVRGVYTSYEDTAGSADVDGAFGLFYVGGEYRVRPGLLVGMLAQFDWTDEKDDRTSIGAEGEGWMVGPYIVGKMADQIYFQARAAWGKSDNDVSPFGTYTDDFDTERWLASAKIEGRFRRGPWRVSPIGSIIYFEDEQERYTDTLGNTIPGQSVSLGRVTFGPQIAYSMNWANGKSLELYGEATGIWDFDVDDRVVSGLNVGAEETRAKLTAGIILRGHKGLRFQASGFLDGLGADDYEAYGGTVKVRVPLN